MTFEVNQKVHYIPFEGCDSSQYENGMIKSVREYNHVFVVYHCNEDWENFNNYTAQCTIISKLKAGWI